MMAVAAVALPPAVSAEQSRYARWLDRGAHAGMVLLAVTFVAYLAGWTTPQVPLQRLPELWGLPVSAFVQATGSPRGWQWLALLRHGDVLNLAGIALLAGCSVPCLVSLLPLYAQRGDRPFVAICVAQVLVLLAAASGWLTMGH